MLLNGDSWQLVNEGSVPVICRLQSSPGDALPSWVTFMKGANACPPPPPLNPLPSLVQCYHTLLQPQVHHARPLSRHHHHCAVAPVSCPLHYVPRFAAFRSLGPARVCKTPSIPKHLNCFCLELKLLRPSMTLLQVPITLHLSRGCIGRPLEPPNQPVSQPHPPLILRFCSLLLSSDVKSPPFPADAGDAPVAAAAAAASLALAEDRVLTVLPLPLAIELFLLALAALPSPLLPRAAHAVVCASGNGRAASTVTITCLVELGHASQRQAGLFGSVSAAFAAVAHGLPAPAASALVVLLASAVFQVRCDDSLVLASAQPVAKRISAFAHVANDGSKRLQRESAFIREQLGMLQR